MAVALRLVIGLVILVAFYRLVADVVVALLQQSLNPLDQTVFERVFGEILTLLIALEFNHTLQYVVSDERGIVRAKIVILIALLALARKVIVLDLMALPPAVVGALAGLILSLGATYWMVRERDDFQREAGRGGRQVSEPGRSRPPPEAP